MYAYVSICVYVRKWLVSDICTGSLVAEVFEASHQVQTPYLSMYVCAHACVCEGLCCKTSAKAAAESSSDTTKSLGLVLTWISVSSLSCSVGAKWKQVELAQSVTPKGRPEILREKGEQRKAASNVSRRSSRCGLHSMRGVYVCASPRRAMSPMHSPSPSVIGSRCMWGCSNSTVTCPCDTLVHERVQDVCTLCVCGFEVY